MKKQKAKTYITLTPIIAALTAIIALTCSCVSNPSLTPIPVPYSIDGSQPQ